MIYLLLVVILLLVIVILQLRHQVTENKKATVYISHKLKEIIETGSSEKLLYMSDSKENKALLVEVNHVLNHNQKVIAKHKHLESSMKKMLSNMSHDMKTPLTVIRGYIDMIINAKSLTDDEQHEYLSQIKTKSIEMQDLIDKFFSLSKLESGDESIVNTRVHVNEVCRQVLLNHYHTIQTKSLDVAVNIAEGDLYAHACKSALERVLNNLISNAIAYGSDGKVVGLEVEEETQHIKITIWDKGKGFDNCEKDKIFDRLYTLEDSRNKAYMGSGLGLCITKKLVELMHGNIEVKSKPYELTAFTVYLNKLTL